MTPLRQALIDYLAVRRALGYQLKRTEQLLHQFLTYAERCGDTQLRLPTMLAWATLPGGEESGWPAYRLGIVRRFASHVQAINPAAEVPPIDVLPWRQARATPYLYSDDEVTAVVAATAMLRTSHRRATYRTLIRLLVVTGMRVGEALALDRGDMDVAERVLTVRHTKFGKSRELPVHPSTVAALRAYLQRNDRPRAATHTPAVFVSLAGTRLLYCGVHWTFHRLVRQAGLAPRSATCRPRIHALRRADPARRLSIGQGPAGPTLRALDVFGPHRPGSDVLVFIGGPRVTRTRGRTPPASSRRWAMSAVAPTLQAFFTERLVRQRQASPQTIAAYRDTMRLLMRFAAQRLAVEPSQLDWAHLDAALISAFLDDREHAHRNSIRTRNARLAAIRSMFRFAALRHPEHAATIARVLAIPPKRFERRLITFLTEPEVAALLAAPDRRTWTGRRDGTWLALAVQTGLRASELIGARCADVHLGVGAHISCVGKGRKHRITPLIASVVALLRVWLAERRGQGPDPLFPTRTGKALSRDALEHRLASYVPPAIRLCASLHEKTISLHVLRHTAAMRLLHAGVDTSVIALWLGHEQVETTQMYLHADLSLKERALARTTPVATKPGRYQPPDAVLAFLEGL
jgi:site-specific recombinase XerD